MKEFYRYYDTPGYYDYYGVNINMETLYLVKETLKGYWISYDLNYSENKPHFIGHRKRWISKTSRKRFAYPTKEEAIESFTARKRRQVAILTGQLERAKIAWAEASDRLQPINQEAKHLTKEAHDLWSHTTKQI